MRTQCELIAVMLSERLIAESVTLKIFNVDLELFLNRLYDTFVDSVHSALRLSRFKKVTTHAHTLSYIVFMQYANYSV